QKNKFTESFPFLVSRSPTAYPDHTDISKQRSRSRRFPATRILPHVTKHTTTTTTASLHTGRNKQYRLC
ncbi:hypothetical protein IRJ41_015484, partial [Triplophysa rosa]